MRHGKVLAGGNGEEPPAIPQCGTINLDRNPVDIERFVVRKRMKRFNGAQPLLKRFYEKYGGFHGSLPFKKEKAGCAVTLMGNSQPAVMGFGLLGLIQE